MSKEIKPEEEKKMAAACLNEKGEKKKIIIIAKERKAFWVVSKQRMFSAAQGVTQQRTDRLSLLPASLLLSRFLLTGHSQWDATTSAAHGVARRAFFAKHDRQRQGRCAWEGLGERGERRPDVRLLARKKGC